MNNSHLKNRIFMNNSHLTYDFIRYSSAHFETCPLKTKGVF